MNIDRSHLKAVGDPCFQSLGVHCKVCRSKWQALRHSSSLASLRSGQDDVACHCANRQSIPHHRDATIRADHSMSTGWTTWRRCVLGLHWRGRGHCVTLDLHSVGLRARRTMSVHVDRCDLESVRGTRHKSASWNLVVCRRQRQAASDCLPVMPFLLCQNHIACHCSRQQRIPRDGHRAISGSHRIALCRPQRRNSRHYNRI